MALTNQEIVDMALTNIAKRDKKNKAYQEIIAFLQKSMQTLREQSLIENRCMELEQNIFKHVTTVLVNIIEKDDFSPTAVFLAVLDLAGVPREQHKHYADVLANSSGNTSRTVPANSPDAYVEPDIDLAFARHILKNIVPGSPRELTDINLAIEVLHRRAAKVGDDCAQESAKSRSYIEDAVAEMVKTHGTPAATGVIGGGVNYISNHIPFKPTSFS